MGESAKVGNLTAITYKHSDDKMQFIIKGAEKSRHSRYGQAQSVGTLTAMPHGTQVKWVVYNRIAERVFFGCVLMLGLIITMIIIPHWVMLPISLVIMGLFYRNIIHEALQIARYPKQVLRN